jgi:probable HAF family extracellular repeat protein
LAYIWKDGVVRTISISGSLGLTGMAINDSGFVTGEDFQQTGLLSFVYDGVTAQHLGTLGGLNTWARDINNQGFIVGYSSLPGNEIVHAFLYDGNTMIDLGDLSGKGRGGYAYGINNLNQIVGDASDVTSTAYLYDNGNLTYLGPGAAYGINDSTWVVGRINIDPFIWKSNTGVVTLERLPGSTLADANAINNAGIIVGKSYGPATAVMWTDSGVVNLNTVVDAPGWDLWQANDINDLGQIVGFGRINGENRAFLLNPIMLEITTPERGETWIAGEQDTIRWNSSEVETLEIELSIDNGNTYETLETSYPASNGEYVWSTPDTLLSRKCKIRITANTESLQDIFGESDLFKIKGYYLTRITPDGDYEKFVPNEDGWQIGNFGSSMWPQQWWNQFNYDGTDPITNKQYSTEFNKLSIPSSVHPDWPLWVETFGINQCYWFTSSALYKTNSVKRWKRFIGFWSGSCYGFSVTSFLGFNYKTEFIGKHPGISNYSNLFELAISDSIRKTINQYYIYQKGLIALQNGVVSKEKKPWTTLEELREMFISENRNINTLSFYSNRPNGGGHNVSPYEIKKDDAGSGKYRIYVYDSRNPGSDSSYILIDSTFNLWTDRLVPRLNWHGRNNFYLEPPISNFLPQPILPGFINPISSLSGNPLTEFYSTYNSEYLFTTVSGDSVGFLGDSVVFNLEEGIPIVPVTGMPHPPIGFYIPSNEYFIYMNNFTDPDAYITVFGDVTYDYQRKDAVSNQTDRFYYNGNFSVSSEDAEIKNIDLSTVIERDDSEKTIYLENTTISQSDSLDLSIQDYDKLTFKNYGSEKSYDLRTIYAIPGSGAFFLNTDITLAANTSHQIVPMWEDLVNTPVTVYVDNGIDGTIDDTLMLNNLITNVEDRGNLYVPKEYKLEQNYPNPFNPSTIIRFALPKASNVNLEVFNILGERVATLVNREMIAGFHEINFDAAQLSSGIYIYRIIADRFVETKKMILLR